MSVRREQILYIKGELPDWKKMDAWQEGVSYVKTKTIRGVAMEVSAQENPHDDGAAMRGFLVHEAKTHKSPLPKHAFVAWYGVPMSVDEVQRHLEEHGAGGYPVLFVEDGTVYCKEGVRVV